ncbi:hypothetical protein FRC04_008516 [Tulasnella sp. 424]|nr:hypothetical protein FRC04_008516 [Tulasnella sp. 424]KAG8973993.1 hypothetical protein FRC05_008050 [Tulasnella sp. 425]
MARNKNNNSGSKFINKPNASGSATPSNPSLEIPPAQDLPTIPTPVEPQPQQRPPSTNPSAGRPSVDTIVPEPKPESTKTTESTQPTEVPLPPSALMTPSEQLPTVAPINESATSSASPSRTATPATAAYETAGYETPMASRTPSPRSIRPSLGAAVRRTLNIDWPLNLVVNSKNELVPFTHTFLTPSLAPGEGDQSTITCASEYAHGDSGIRITLDLGYPATLDLKIFNQFDASRPIFSRFRDTADAPEFRIPWRFLRVLTGPHVQPSIMISLVITTAPPAPTETSFNYIPPVVSETTSPAAIEALAHFLDQPGGHDVVFCFPDRKHLYADRYVLQRASPFFRNLFEVRNRESGIVPGVGVGIGAGIGQGKSALADDSDVEMTPTKENGENAPRGRSGSSGSSRSRRTSERDITTLAGSTVITPMTSVHGDGVQDNIPLPLDTKGFMFQRTTSPLMDDNIFVMNINETSFNTFRAFLYYLYTGFISFSPLTSSFQFPDQPDLWSPGQPSTLEQRRLEARNTLVGEYMRKYPNRPVPVSPKSIYQVARKYEVPSLEAQALSRISTAIFNPLVATAELFSAFTRVHESIKQSQIQVVIDNWNQVVKTEDWAIAREKGKAQPDQYFAGVLCEILEALPPRSA